MTVQAAHVSTEELVGMKSTDFRVNVHKAILEHGNLTESYHLMTRIYESLLKSFVTIPPG